jgi:hypothetical protein
MFFWTEYHLGKINVILHLVSFSLMFCGLAVKSAPVVLIGLFVFDEMENAYITSLCINGTLDSVSELIPYQLLYASLIMPVLFKLFGWF